MLGRKKKPPPPMPGWMRIGMILFVLFAAVNLFRNQDELSENNDTPEERSTPRLSIKEYPALSRFTNLDHWIRNVQPDYGKSIERATVQGGQGHEAACGQTVNIAYEYQDDKTQPAALPPSPLRFTLGQEPPALVWHFIVSGMQQGQTQTVIAGPRYFDETIQDPDAPGYQLGVTLNSLEPYLDTPGAFGIETLREGIDKTLLGCGEVFQGYVRVYDETESLLYDSTETGPLEWVVGESRYGHGLDRAALGMNLSELRRVRIPPAYQNDTLGFPQDKTAIVELVRLTYKEFQEINNQSTTEPKEPEDDRDSQPPASDQTLPDDGGDRQGSGAESSR